MTELVAGLLYLAGVLIIVASVLGTGRPRH